MKNARQLSLLPLVAALGCHAASDGSLALDEAKAPVEIGRSQASGPKDAPVTIIVATDYQCPYCKRHEGTLAKLQRMYPDRVRIVVKHQPLPMHARARTAALAAEAAGAQGKFWPMHGLLFERQGDIDKANFVEWAEELGLDAARFEADMAAADLEEWIDADRARLAKAGARGTPTTWVNGQRITGAQPLSKFVEIVAAELGEPMPEDVDVSPMVDEEGC